MVSRFYEGLNSNDQVVWAICHEEDGHIGNVSLGNIATINRNAEFAILIGDRYWRKSVILNASLASLNHGFGATLNAFTVALQLAMSNEFVALRLGMVEEGRRRKHSFSTEVGTTWLNTGCYVMNS